MTGVSEKRRELSYILFITIVLALVFVIADLSRSWNMPSAILNAILGGTFGLTRSWMAVGIVLLLVGLLLTLILALRHTVNSKTIAAIADSKTFDVILILVGLLITIYSGFLIAAAPGIPFWNTPLLPVLWLISASICAVALVKILIHNEAISRLATRYGLGLEVSEIIALLAWINISPAGSSIGARTSAAALMAGDFAAEFWGGVVTIGIILPSAIEIYLLKHENKTLGYLAAVLALIGALILRIAVLQAGTYEPTINPFSFTQTESWQSPDLENYAK